MAGCTPGQFVFVSLPTAVVLTPVARYYLVSEEKMNGDRWLDLEPIVTAPGASSLGGVYRDVLNSSYPGSWMTLGAAGTAYVPTTMRYEVVDEPPSAGFVLSYNHDNRLFRNNFTGFVGMSLKVGAQSLIVVSVGRPLYT
jgi:hypothetical protein